MSVSLMSLVWDRAPYEGGTLLVLLALADWANEDGVTWPSMATLAAKARMQIRNTQYILRILEADQMITRERQGSGRETTVYRLNVEALCAMPLAWKRPGPPPPPPAREQNISVPDYVPRQNLHDAPQCTPGVQPGAPVTGKYCTPDTHLSAPLGCNQVHPNHHRSTREREDPLPPDELGVEQVATQGEVGEQKHRAGPSSALAQPELNRAEIRTLLASVWREESLSDAAPDAPHRAGATWPHAPPDHGPAP